MPFPSSAATTSPATSEAARGSMKTERKSSISTGVASPDCVIWAAKMLSAPRPWRWWTFWNTTKNSGRIDHERESEVGALLGDQLAQLPAVDGQRRGAPHAGDARSGCGGELTAALLIRSRPPSEPRAGAASAAPGAAGSPAGPPGAPLALGCARALGQSEEQVLERRQLRRQREDPDSRAARASDSSPTSRSSAWKWIPCAPLAACSMPRWARATSSARASSVVRSR